VRTNPGKILILGGVGTKRRSREKKRSIQLWVSFDQSPTTLEVGDEGDFRSKVKKTTEGRRRRVILDLLFSWEAGRIEIGDS